MKNLLVLGLLVLGLSSCKMDMEDTELCANGDQLACQRLADSLTTPPPARVMSEESISPLIHNKTCTVKSINTTQEELEDLGLVSETSVESFLGRTFDMTSLYETSTPSGTSYTNFQTSPHTGLTFHVAQTIEGDEDEEIAAAKHKFKLRGVNLTQAERFYMIANFKAYDDGRMVGTVSWIRSASGWLRVENNFEMKVVLECK